ncbi:hypothetical protein AAIR98_001111 [Elusimicrobium simillimum]|uniref:hypothetical protein n=1 Tax=Elusimicrobium simillimum TaxID=3143438 RepID=UPI003C700D0D
MKKTIIFLTVLTISAVLSAQANEPKKTRVNKSSDTYEVSETKKTEVVKVNEIAPEVKATRVSKVNEKAPEVKKTRVNNPITPQEKEAQAQAAQADLLADPQPKAADPCANFPAYMTNCTPFKCNFKHPMTGESMLRNISGLDKNKRCLYREQMPESGLMTCRFAQRELPAVADVYRKASALDPLSIQFSTEPKIADTVSIQKYIDNGTCTITLKQD